MLVAQTVNLTGPRTTQEISGYIWEGVSRLGYLR